MYNKTIHGYHGTSSFNVENIVEKNLNLSEGKSHWLGNGVYFFLEGITDPKDLAKEWAIAESWDNERKSRTFYEYSVLESEIILDNDTVLDLTSRSGLQVFNYFRDRYKKSLPKKRLRTNINDWQLLELMKKDIGIEIIIASVYIKFTLERVYSLESRIPNCAIMCVSNTDKIIQNSLIEVDKGGIKDVF